MPTSTNHQPDPTTTAHPAPSCPEPTTTSDSGRDTAPAPGSWRARYRAQQDARRRLAERYGSVLQKRWAANPNAPRVDAVSLLYAFLNKAGPATLRSREMEHAPALERADALAAAHMIRVARDDARYRETAVIRHILPHGVTWNELAHTLDTTPDQLHHSLRQHGQQPNTWAVSAASACNASFSGHPPPSRQDIVAALTGEPRPHRPGGGDPHDHH